MTQTKILTRGVEEETYPSRDFPFNGEESSFFCVEHIFPRRRRELKDAQRGSHLHFGRRRQRISGEEFPVENFRQRISGKEFPAETLQQRMPSGDFPAKNLWRGISREDFPERNFLKRSSSINFLVRNFRRETSGGIYLGLSTDRISSDEELF